MPQAKAHNVSETGSVSLFPVKGCGGDPPMMCPLLSDRPSRTGTPPFCFYTGKGRYIQGSMHFATDPAGQVLHLSVFLSEKGDISSLLYIFLFLFYLR